MGTQYDSLDISQLKAFALGLNEEQSQDRALGTASRNLEHNQSDKAFTEDVSSRKSRNNRSQPHNLTQSQPWAGYQPQSRPPGLRSRAQRYSASQPELPSTIPESSRVKMLSSDSQSQGDTQPVSQWVYDEFRKRSGQRATGTTSETNETISKDQGDASHSIQQGQSGHVDLLGIFEQPPNSHLDGTAQDHDEDDIDLSPAPSVSRDIFSAPRPFQHPNTPASQSRKRKRGSEVHSQEAETPNLPVNPFAGNMSNNDGIMNSSQLFKATQALTSPLTNIVPSDGLSERPSPDMYHVRRPSTAGTMSSPARLPRSGMARAVTEPQTTYISMKESQEARERQEQAMRLAQNISTDELSDDGFGSADTQLRRRLKQKRINLEARAQFAGVTARSELMFTGRGRGCGGRLRNTPCRTPTRRQGREASVPVLISDDTPPEDVQGNVTEDETEREDEADMEEDDEADELGEDNKENVEVPMTIARAHQSTSQVISSQPSPSHRRLRKRKASSQNKRAIQLGSSPQLIRSQSALRSSGDGTQTDAIADSQPSQTRVRIKLNSTTSPMPVFSEPRTSLDARILVPQSQASEASNTNGSDRRTDVQPEKASSQGTPTTVSKINHPQERSETHQHNMRAGKNLIVGVNAEPPEIGRSSVVAPASGTSTHPNYSAAALSHQGRSPETRSMTGGNRRISEGPYGSSNLMPSPRSTPKSASQPTSSYSMADQSRPSTLFETAQENLPRSPSMSVIRMQQKSQSQQGSPVRSRRSRTVGEIVADHCTPDEFGDVDVDINILSKEDVEFQRAISGSSPIAPARKRRRGGRGTGLPTAELEATNLPALPRSPLPPSSSAISAITPIHAPSQDDVRSPSAALPNRALTKKKNNRLPKSVERLTHDRAPTALPSGVSNPVHNHSATDLRANELTVDTRQTAHLADAALQHDAVEGVNRQSVTAPNRVFAHFNGTTPAYHPATCLQVVGGDDPRYTVRFDDGTVDTITGYSIKRLELRHGDLVKVDIPGSRNKIYVVEGMRDPQSTANPPDPATPSRRGRAVSTNDPAFPEIDIHGFATVLVSPKQRASGNADLPGQSLVAVPIPQLYLTQTMWASFKDRPYTHISNKPQPLTGLQTPSERPSTPSTPSSRTRRAKTSGLAQSRSTTSIHAGDRIFRNMAFAITNIDRSGDSERIKTQISVNGGSILDKGFDELFHIPPLTRTTAPKEISDNAAFGLTPTAKDLGFTCLIADKFCRRAKFVQALALGIPCLATRWISDCVAKQRLLPWGPYLLPSGASSFLGGAVRSRILQPFPAETATLSAIIENRPKLLENSTVLLIMEKGQEQTMKQHPLITHALGARKISRAINEDAAAKAVSDAQALGEPWDWVFSYDKERAVEERLFGGAAAHQTGKKRKRGRDSDVLNEMAGGRNKRGRTRVVGNEFVIQSLILGMLVEE